MTTNPSHFAVLLKDENQLNWNIIASALSKIRGVPSLDTINEAKQCWGILSENVAYEDAVNYQRILREHGVEAVVTPMENLRAVSVPLILKTAEPTVDHLVLIGERGERSDLLWTDILVWGAAAISTTHVRKIIEKQGPSGAQKMLSVGIMLATGLPIKVGPKKKTIEKSISDTNLSFILDIVQKGTYATFRLIADDFNFAFLKERMLHGAMPNFRLVLSDWASRAPQARQSRGTRMLLSNQPLSNMGYESLAHLEKEIRWLKAI